MRNKKEGKADMQVLLVEQQKEDKENGTKTTNTNTQANKSRDKRSGQARRASGKTEQVAKNNLSEKYDQAIEEAQSFYADQSGKVATISRSIVFGMIGTIWVVWYSDGEIKDIHFVTLLSMFFCFVYLMYDVFLYFQNALFYHDKLVQLEDNFKKSNYLDKSYSDELLNYSKKACANMKRKYWIFIFVSVSFVVGMYCQLYT